jgi:hypothetical protein
MPDIARCAGVIFTELVPVGPLDTPSGVALGKACVTTLDSAAVNRIERR